MRANRSFILLGVLTCSTAWAGPFTLPQLDQADVDATAKTLASDLSFRPLEPASTFGKYVGVSFGFEADTASTTQMSSFLPSPKYIPAGNLFFALQLPAGVGLEAGIVPRISYNGGHFSEYGGALKWTFSEFLNHSPVDLAARILYSHASLDFNESLNGGNVDVGYTTNTYGAAIGVSKSLFILEPYADFGLLNQSSTLTGTGSATIFGTSYPAGTESATSKSTCAFFDVGLQLHLTVIQLTAEYSDRFGANAFAGKLSFKF